MDATTGAFTQCDFRFRFKTCRSCGAENDVAARTCSQCRAVIIDDDAKLKEAMALKDAHVMRVDSMALEETLDRKRQPRLEVSYFDADGQALKEWFHLGTPTQARAFFYAFTRLHLRRPELVPRIDSVADAVRMQALFRVPSFVIARKKERFWQIREKIFG